MVQPTYPGVYIKEVPSGVRTVTEAATSIAAFVDFFRQGPMNEAVELNGMGDFVRIFGGLDSRSEGSYAIDQFFRNGGTKAYAVRVASGTGNDAAAKASVEIKNHPGGAVKVLRISAVDEGTWGNTVRIVVDRNPGSKGTFDMIVSRHVSTDANAPAAVVESHFALSPDKDSARYVKAILNEESNLVTVEDLNEDVKTSLPADSGTLGKQTSDLTAAQIGSLKDKVLKLKVVDKGNDIVKTHNAIIRFDSAPPTTMKALRPYIERAVREAKNDADPSLPTHALLAGANVSMIDVGGGAFRCGIRVNMRAASFSPSAVVDVLSHGGAGGVDAVLGLRGAGPISENVQQYVLGGANSVSQQNGVSGSDGKKPDATALKGVQGDKPTGMYALAKIDLFNILCMPRVAELDDNPMDMLVGDIVTFCEEQRAFFIVDIPKTKNTVEEIMDWIEDKASFRHKNTAVYFPRIKVADPLDEFRLKSRGVSGTIAGIYARTDATRGVWKAPAGLDARLRGVSELDFKMTDPENGSINPIAVNAIRVFPIHGQVVWGARTLDGADAATSEWRYISVRRTALMIEESLYRGTKWVCFEPNDEPTWAKIRQNVGAFMMSLFRQGAFQGSDPKDAFYVRCDGDTTTATDRNKGIVNIEVGFAPLKPAEFVVIKIQQIPDIN
jgi:phage tail sheath protein FI